MRKKHWLLVAATAVVIFGALMLFPPAPEPMYRGKPLTYWLQAYSIPFPVARKRRTSPDRPTRVETEEAINAMGANALPTLLQIIQHRLRGLALQWHVWMARITTGQPPSDLNIGAVEAFNVLGAKAAPAVPQLIEIYNKRKDHQDKYWGTQNDVIRALAYIGPPAQPAIPMLLGTLSSTNIWLRQNAITAIGNIHAGSAEVVPALVSCLKDPDANIRLKAIMALQQFGPEAKAAVPALLELVRDPKLGSGPTNGFRPSPGFIVKMPTIGEQVTNALWNIDPEAAAKAGIKNAW